MTMGRAVDVVDNAYDPQTMTISAGDIVTWVNIGALPHTVTFADGFDCGILNTGQGASREFESPGTFAYACIIHPEMTGTVVVE